MIFPFQKIHLSSGSIQHQTLVSAIGLTCDIRLGILLACELGILMSADQAIWSISTPLLGLAANWIIIRIFSNRTLVVTSGWEIPCFDLIITSLVVIMCSTYFSGGLHLSLAYILASAVLIGLIGQALWASIWSISIIFSLAVIKLRRPELAPVITAAMTAGVFTCVLLGNRLRTQFQEIDRLSNVAASARAEERALTERITIARDLHDSLAKSVHGIRMLAETLDSSLTSENHPDALLSHMLFESADEASREARLVLDGLRSGGDEDIISTLSGEADRWSARTGIPIMIEQAAFQNRLFCSTEAMWQLQRILGEILSNVEKHAQATSVDISMFHDSDYFALDVQDNGIGFIDHTAEDLDREGHYGLAGMKERTGILNGSFTINSPPTTGFGTLIQLRIPMVSLNANIYKEKSV